MKICFISPKAYPLFNPKIKSVFGGSEAQLYFLGKELAARTELEVVFIVGNYGQPKKEIIGNVVLYKYSKTREFFEVFNRVGADVYVQRALTFYSALMALYCRLRKKKFVYMIANDKEVSKNIISGLVFRLANIVITQNKYQENGLKRRGIKKASLIFPASLIKKNNYKKDNFILWVGRIDKYYKNPETFLELAKNFPSENFIMIGPSATNQGEYFRTIKKEAEKIKSLKFMGLVPFDKIEEYFQKAKIFINTSFSEGFPTAFIQATKYRTPIISLNVNPNNFLNEYQCGFVCGGDLNMMAGFINKLLDNERLYNKFSDNAYRYAKENHDIKINAQRFYEKLTS